MKVLHFNTYENEGGAARAAYSVHTSLLEIGVDSTLRVSNKKSNRTDVIGGTGSAFALKERLKRKAGREAAKLIRSENMTKHSVSLFPTFMSRFVNRSSFDIVNLHWIADEFISIGDLGRFRKPVVWSLCDTWAFCGAEHYPLDDSDERFAEGYTPKNRPAWERGLDLNRWTWKRKVRAWKDPMHIVAPSKWMAEKTRKSLLMKDWPVSVIPHPINTLVFSPVDRAEARAKLDLPQDTRLILIGLPSGLDDPRKGWDLLAAALEMLSGRSARLACVVLGVPEGQQPRGFAGLQIFARAPIRDDVLLNLYYSACDLIVVPSRLEAFGLAAAEPQAAGCPVVAFDTSGLRDVVADGETGMLVSDFSPAALANAIDDLLASNELRSSMSAAARGRAVSLWAHEKIAAAYSELYQEICNRAGGTSGA
jgi:glycosyltransferase involved in cell wall biosynthesis